MKGIERKQHQNHLGVSADGVSADGVSADGVSADGVSADGVSADGVSADGVSFQLEIFARLSSTSFDAPHMSIDYLPHFIDAYIDRFEFPLQIHPRIPPSLRFN